MIYYDIDQRSPEWYALRWGRITGTEFKALVGTQAARNALAKRKRYELSNPVEVPDEINVKSLNWGRENEGRAAAHYEMFHVELSYPAFVTHPEHDFIGFSPDGLSERSGAEIKCPYDSAIHQATWMLGMPKEHIPQVQGGMWVCERDEWDFISFDPRMAPPKDFYCQTIRRDEQFIKRLEINALRVWDMVMSDKQIGGELDEIPQLFGGDAK